MTITATTETEDMVISYEDKTERSDYGVPGSPVWDEIVDVEVVGVEIMGYDLVETWDDLKDNMPESHADAAEAMHDLGDKMADRIEALEAENARLKWALEVFADDTNWFDVTEDNIRYPAWRGPVYEPEEFARAALAKARGETK
jgi:hypothetical protein